VPRNQNRNQDASTAPWQLMQRGCWKIGASLEKASIDFRVCESESGQTGPPLGDGLVCVRARVERKTNAARSFTSRRYRAACRESMVLGGLDRGSGIAYETLGPPVRRAGFVNGMRFEGRVWMEWSSETSQTMLPRAYPRLEMHKW
jgi:hypothetical protein